MQAVWPTRRKRRTWRGKLRLRYCCVVAMIEQRLLKFGQIFIEQYKRVWNSWVLFWSFEGEPALISENCMHESEGAWLPNRLRNSPCGGCVPHPTGNSHEFICSSSTRVLPYYISSQHCQRVVKRTSVITIVLDGPSLLCIET